MCRSGATPFFISAICDDLNGRSLGTDLSFIGIVMRRVSGALDTHEYGMVRPSLNLSHTLTHTPNSHMHTLRHTHTHNSHMHTLTHSQPHTRTHSHARNLTHPPTHTAFVGCSCVTLPPYCQLLCSAKQSWRDVLWRGRHGYSQHHHSQMGLFNTHTHTHTHALTHARTHTHTHTNLFLMILSQRMELLYGLADKWHFIAHFVCV